MRSVVKRVPRSTHRGRRTVGNGGAPGGIETVGLAPAQVPAAGTGDLVDGDNTVAIGSICTDPPAPEVVDGPNAQRSGSALLRRALVALDSAAIALAWLAAAVVPTLLTPSERPIAVSTALVVGCVVLGLWLLSSQRLYLARVCSVRTVEITRVAKVAVLLGVISYAGTQALGVGLTVVEAIGGSACTLLFLLMFRSGYRGWLRARRMEGRFSRPVLLIGTNDETAEIHHLLSTHPELGFEVCGVLGERAEADRRGMAELWLGPVTDAVAQVRASNATGAVVIASSVPVELLNRTIRDMMQRGIHVHVTSGLRGFDHRRLRAQPLAYEPIFYLEPLSLSRLQLSLKRAIDLTLTGVALLFSLPLLVASALVIKLDDGGPILFRQQRVGRNGRVFKIYKLRTMVLDAEQRLEQLKDRNERQGPLFKLTGDPRVTRVGRVLRACSIDELPQLFNVLRGEMSLVGPRPALPSEAADFDEQLLARTQVLPGITGLWQVEARDNSSFATYRRLDLFYVENWSVTLDLVVLLATLESEISRMIRALVRHRTETAPVAALD